MEATIVKHGRRSMGYGFVLFDTVDDVDKAKSQLDKAELEGRQINVETAKTNQSILSSSRRRRNRRRVSSRGRSSTRTNNTEKDDHDQQQHPKRGPRRRQSSRAKDTRRKSEPSTTMVFVANIPYATTDEDLQDLFKDYKVNSAQVARARSGRSKGYAFVDLISQNEQQRALEEMKHVELDGRIIYLKPAMSSSSPITETSIANNNDDTITAAAAGQDEAEKHKENDEEKSTTEKEKGDEE